MCRVWYFLRRVGSLSNCCKSVKEVQNNACEATVRVDQKAVKKRSVLIESKCFIRFAHCYAAVLKQIQPKGCERFLTKP